MRPTGLFVRGLLMGVSEILPGISGGTVAYVTGIYQELVAALAAPRYATLHKILSQLRPHARFLLPVTAGMALGVVAGIAIVVDVIEIYPLQMWGFIFGLLVGAAIQIARGTTTRDLTMFGLIGLVIGIALGIPPAAQTDSFHLLMYALAGYCAFVAWLMPGISGSMVLVLLGLWLPLLQAIRSFDFAIVGMFLGGLVLAVATVPRLVEFLLSTYRTQLVGLFAGLVAGGCTRAWPWRSLDGYPTLPLNFSTDAHLLSVSAMGALGFGLIAALMIYDVSRRKAG